MKKTPLKRTKPINRYSLRRIKELNEEAEVRVELCKRAGGMPLVSYQYIRKNGKVYPVQRVLCINGHCEICGQFKAVLEPHEDPPRSRGGKVSLTGSKMVCRACHRQAQNNEPIWNKE